MTRRTVLAAGAVALGGCARQQSSVQKAREAARVTILRAPAYDQSLYDTVRRLLTEQGLDVRGKRVVLKPNLVEYDPERPINTHPLFVHAAMEAFRAMGAASVALAEGPGHRRDALDLADSAGYFAQIPGFEDAFTDLNLAEVERVKIPHPRSRLTELYLPTTLLRADLIVSLAKMKTHHWVGATLTMKNFFGTVPSGVYGWPKNVLHYAGIDECIADLHTLFPKHFGLVDGVYGMQGNGPIQGEPKFAGVIVGGRDLPAVDATCARIMGIDPAQMKYLQLTAGLEGIQEGRIQQAGETIASVRTDFELFGKHKEWRLGAG